MRWFTAILFSLSVATAQGQLTVSNGATLVPTTTVAPGSMVAIRLVPQPGEPLQTIDPTSRNVTILPDGANFAMECGIVPVNESYVLFLDPLAVIAVLPSTLPLGPARLSLYHSGLTATAQISIVESRLGLFPSRQGPYALVVQQMGSDQAQRPNQLTHPAQPGDTVTLWGTGLGSATQVTVLLGGKAVAASSAGRAPGMPGVDQIQFAVSDDATIPNDCYVAVAAQVAGVTSNTNWISKTSDGSACQSSFGLTAADLATLDAGGAVGLAQLTVGAETGDSGSRFASFLTGPIAVSSHGFVSTESATFFPLQVNAAESALISGPVVADDSYFGCSVPPLDISAIIGTSFNPYNIGTTVTLKGAGGRLDLTSELVPAFFLSGVQTSPVVSGPNQLPPPLFTPGTWTFSGNGGTSSPGSPAATPFSVQLTLPPEIMATNFSALQTINRQRDLVVMWDPAGYGQQDVLMVRVNDTSNSLVSSLERSPFGRLGFIGQTVVSCTIPATGGQLVIPAAMLQNLTPGKTAGLPTASLALSVSQRSGHAQTFSLPLADGNSLHAILQFSSSETWRVTVE